MHARLTCDCIALPVPACPKECLHNALLPPVTPTTHTHMLTTCTTCAFTPSPQQIAVPSTINYCSPLDKTPNPATHTKCAQVVGVQPLSAVSRHTAAFVPLPHPWVGGPPRQAGKHGRVPRCLEPIEVMVQLEGSGV